MKRSVLNFIAFQIGWFACVLGAANGLPWLGLVVAALLVALHLQYAPFPGHEARLVLYAVVLGLVFDSLLVLSGWLRYPNGMFFQGIAPYWILAMWALFATTFNASMGWLKNKLLLASVMGAIFGPLSYMAGQRLGALEIVDFNASMLALAAIWSLAMPLLVFAAARRDDVGKPISLIPLQRLSKGD